MMHAKLMSPKAARKSVLLWKFAYLEVKRGVQEINIFAIELVFICTLIYLYLEVCWYKYQLKKMYLIPSQELPSDSSTSENSLT